MRERTPPRLLVGGMLLALVAGLALVAAWWTPVAEPLRLRMRARLLAPGSEAWFGTDALGRDTFSLLMLGAGQTLVVAVVSVLIGAALGTAIGLLAALRGGRLERALMRAMDLLFAFPPVLSALMLGAALGAGRTSAIAAIALFTLPVFARVARNGARRVLAQDFVRAARALGVPGAGIVRRHVLPAIGGEVAVQASIQMGLAVITEAGLSFIGVGPPPPAPSWGRMLADAQTYLGPAPWLLAAPAGAIALLVLGFNLAGDGLRDLLDPRRAR
ncbi:ABC transporter permease [Aureimonas jatrophae]|uniref:Peptide/nickel transport system permease protein n=1 Tax=Aureimonas jatrophae TaxID=1166073 RepID=A0A1H0KKC0_9HYPH|nr:ABC transporter permease [Aureimonas jatrophae]MBB3948752.1 peptide/nickel transport system permease protein [Aureimonas jatrophae]SDO56444.1 peptide/nickel transport system permease protein [Aureimonas jatrophae]